MGGLLHLVQRGGAWVGLQPTQAPPRCTKCNSTRINGQCTNFVLFDVALYATSVALPMALYKYVYDYSCLWNLKG